MVVMEKTYKTLPCIEVREGDVSATILPCQGAKLCSLKKKGKEYIYQGKGEKYKLSSYGDDFLSGECAGVDEMFPNIDAFYYDEKPWNGILFPDHGEVWAKSWRVMKTCEENICCETVGTQNPYRLKKTISMADETLKFDYELENLSEFEINYIWASHMMIKGERNARFLFPKELSKAYTTMSSSGIIGKYGDTFFYPEVKKSDGSTFDMSSYRGQDAYDYQKFYFADRIEANPGWAEIQYPDSSRFRIEFPTDEVPYIGAIHAEDGGLGIRCMFLEPCTGLFDRPDLAKKHAAFSTIGANEKKNWYLKIKIF